MLDTFLEWKNSGENKGENSGGKSCRRDKNYWERESEGSWLCGGSYKWI